MLLSERMPEISSTDIINAVTGVLTAIFTGWGAYLVWKQQQDQIILEWEEEYHSTSTSIIIRCRIRNRTGSALNAWRADVSGPVLMVSSGKDPKHESWAISACPIRCQPAPGAEEAFSFTISPDWQALSKQVERWHSRVRTQLARWFWKASSGSSRVHHGASLHFHITIDSKSNKRFRKRITQTIWISPQTIERRMTAISSSSNVGTPV